MFVKSFNILFLLSIVFTESAMASDNGSDRFLDISDSQKITVPSQAPHENLADLDNESSESENSDIVVYDYNIDDQLSVRVNFRQDQNNSFFTNLPLEVLKKIASYEGVCKGLYGTSRGFNALCLSGYLPLKILLSGRSSITRSPRISTASYGLPRASYALQKGIMAHYSNDSLPPLEFKISKTPLPITQDDIFTFRNVHNLTLHSLSGTIDVSVLGNVHNLTLYDLENPEGLSALGNVHNLTLENLYNLDNPEDGLCTIDVSAFGNVHTLTLKSLYNLEGGLSALGNVHKLTIMNIIKNLAVVDVSAFGNVQEITLDRVLIEDISICRNIPNVTLRSLEVVDLSCLENAQNITLEHLLEVEDLSCLEKVPKLTLIDMDGIPFSRSDDFLYKKDYHGCFDISMLGKNGQELILEHGSHF